MSLPIVVRPESTKPICWQCETAMSSSVQGWEMHLPRQSNTWPRLSASLSSSILLDPHFRRLYQ
jgi:hypothetical protein